MMENRYRKLTERIHTPAGLNDQVLFEARRRTAEAAPCRERQGWGYPRTKTAFTAAAAPRNWTRVPLRTAVCAVCALALVLGGFSLRPAGSAAPGGVRRGRSLHKLLDGTVELVNGSPVLGAHGVHNAVLQVVLEDDLARIVQGAAHR